MDFWGGGGGVSCAYKETTGASFSLSLSFGTTEKSRAVFRICVIASNVVTGSTQPQPPNTLHVFGPRTQDIDVCTFILSCSASL